MITPPSSLTLLVALKTAFTTSTSSATVVDTAVVSPSSFSKLAPPVTVLIELEIESLSLYTSSLFTVVVVVPLELSFKIVSVSPFAKVIDTSSFATTSFPFSSTSLTVYVITPPSSLTLLVALNTAFTTSTSSVTDVETVLVSPSSFSKLAPPYTVLIELEIESVY